jgi:hypothetical protein
MYTTTRASRSTAWRRWITWRAWSTCPTTSCWRGPASGAASPGWTSQSASWWRRPTRGWDGSMLCARIRPTPSWCWATERWAISPHASSGSRQGIYGQVLYTTVGVDYKQEAFLWRLHMVRHYRRFERKASSYELQTQGLGKDGREMARPGFFSWRAFKSFFKFWSYKNSGLGLDLVSAKSPRWKSQRIKMYMLSYRFSIVLNLYPRV